MRVEGRLGVMNGKSEKLKRSLTSAFRTLLVLIWGFAALLYLGYLGNLHVVEFPWNILVAVLWPVLLFAGAIFLLFLGVGD